MNREALNHVISRADYYLDQEIDLMCYLAKCSDDNWQCSISVPRIMRAMTISMRTTHRMIRRLIQKGELEVTFQGGDIDPQDGKRGNRRKNIYRIPRKDLQDA